MNAFLNRYYMTNEVTLGTLNFQNVIHRPIFTLELPWLDNQKNISCIPEGGYKASPYSSPRYPDVYQVHGVPDRTYILFHIGNYIKNTDGCILPGKTVDWQKPMVGSSGDTMKLIRDIVGDNTFTLKIRNN
jgi:hypothetical protein